VELFIIAKYRRQNIPVSVTLGLISVVIGREVTFCTAFLSTEGTRDRATVVYYFPDPQYIVVEAARRFVLHQDAQYKC